MADARMHVFFAGLGRYVAAEYEVGRKLGIQKSNRQIVLDVRMIADLGPTQDKSDLSYRRSNKPKQRATNVL
jgi:hypothetical protein